MMRMELIKWEPFGDMDRFFDDRFISQLSPANRFGGDLAIDVYEEKGNIIAKMSLPGVKAEEIDVHLEDDVLTISGRREEEKETEGKDYYSKEIRRGSFARAVRLPKEVDTKKVVANYDEGVLKVTMPVIADKKAKATKVEVKKK